MKRIIRWRMIDYADTAYYVAKNKWTFDKEHATRLNLIQAMIKLRKLRKSSKFYGDTYSVEIV